MTNTFLSWNTHKTETGAYCWTVKKVTSSTEPLANGRYARFDLVKQGLCATRAQAKGHAQAWMRANRKAIIQ
jgi:hypothetical protein